MSSLFFSSMARLRSAVAEAQMTRSASMLSSSTRIGSAFSFRTCARIASDGWKTKDIRIIIYISLKEMKTGCYAYRPVASSKVLNGPSRRLERLGVGAVGEEWKVNTDDVRMPQQLLTVDRFTRLERPDKNKQHFTSLHTQSHDDMVMTINSDSRHVWLLGRLVASLLLLLLLLRVALRAEATCHLCTRAKTSQLHVI